LAQTKLVKAHTNNRLREMFVFMVVVKMVKTTIIKPSLSFGGVCLRQGFARHMVAMATYAWGQNPLAMRQRWISHAVGNRARYSKVCGITPLPRMVHFSPASFE